tara:strand:+ start:72 stop:719 length:648 start_codon:yes stop_codon:yes gene_type:complete
MTVRIDGTNTSAAPGITGADTDTGIKFGTNEVDIVTGGTDRVKVNSSGKIILPTGSPGIQFGTTDDPAASGGIDISSQTLHDYEEGDFTPVLQGEDTAGTYTPSSLTAKYVKIGVHVFVFLRMLNIAITSAGVGDITLTGLPFDSPGSMGQVGTVLLDNFNLDSDCKYVVCRMGSNNILQLQQVKDDLGDASLEVGAIDDGVSDMHISLNYIATT